MNKEIFIAIIGVIVAIIIGIFTVIIYKLQLYKNTSSNLRKKHRICNMLILMLLFLLFFIIYIMFVQDKELISNKQYANYNDKIEDNKNNEWGKEYNQFINNYYNFIKETTNNFNANECKFALYDIDKDNIPELFTYYNGIDNIYSYDVENYEMIRMSSPFFSKYLQLYASKKENELIVAEYEYELWEFLYKVFYKTNETQLIKSYDLCERALTQGDFSEYVYYNNSHEISKETYEDKLQELLYDKNQIIFYNIKDIKDSDLSLYITPVDYN